MTRRAVIALGSNLGDRREHLHLAVVRMRDAGVEMLRGSPVFETEPIGPEQQAYLNAVVLVETDLEPNELMSLLLHIEQLAGRVREERWGPRTLDLDIIDIDGVAMETESLTIPHPRSHERAFVLIPWAHVAPDWVHPRTGLTIRAMISAPTADPDILRQASGVLPRPDLSLA